MRAYEIALRSPGSLPRSLYETLFSFMVRDVEILNDDMKLRSLASPRSECAGISSYAPDLCPLVNKAHP